MNWVSYSEDIEEMRAENEHYRRGIDALIDRLKEDKSLHEIHRVENDYRDLADQLVKKYEAIKLQAEQRFQDAVKMLQDPAVRITDKLNKRTRQRDDLRVGVQKCKTELAECRASQARNLSKIAELGKENVSLRREIDKLKDSQSWNRELEGVRRRK